MRTASSLPLGLAPKAILAFLFPLITAVGASLVAWLTGGDVFDVEPIKVALGGLVTSGLALLGAWIGKPAPVVHESPERTPSTTPAQRRPA